MKFDRTMYGTINGGGVEASFSTLNGRIVIKKKMSWNFYSGLPCAPLRSRFCFASEPRP